ncbi:TraB/GumN family protein [Rhodobacter ferrooxidans]|uniref:GumN family protein n=1 Tax=Rhodobacter ferrooxidans TaxID=371731 RepID=C8S323_9RHOB|nr:TraB/GumN family protein [Rhodobacter sp. SW2]EEW24663.1 GumN family protein [Rhodobacter sp. SW2]
MRRLFASLATALLLASPGLAQCVGQNLLTGLDPSLQGQVDAALASQPHATGNFWRATRGDQVLHLIGTYHLDDPRHAATMDRLTPLIATAKTVLLEAGPDEEKALKQAMAQDPSVMFLTEGPSLMQQLQPAEWQALSGAMLARGIPSFMAAKLQPWYASMLLGVPPCAMSQMQNANGLDKRVMAAAKEAGVPLRAMEPYDTVLGLFAGLTEDEKLAMIRAALPLEAQAADYSVTLADSYFAGDSRRMWELMRLQTRTAPGYTPERADAEYAKMEEVLMAARNRAWLPVIEDALTAGPAVAAFGALHLSGQDGVLALLERAGFTLEQLPL